jgi:hypothetical protein
MHSGDIVTKFAPALLGALLFPRVFHQKIEKQLDYDHSICHFTDMTKFIKKVDRTNGIFRLVIPRPIVHKKKWGNVRYIIVDDQYPDKIEIRRFVDDETS